MPPPPSPSSANPTMVPLPPTKTLQKRPLLHPPIQPTSSRSPKVVYISAKTPFMSAVKRLQSYLDAAENAPKSKNQKIISREKQNEDAGVTLKATGKAIDKCLQLGTFFMGKECEVKIKTGSITVVDDVVDLPEGAVKRVGGKKRKREDVEVDAKKHDDVEMVTRVTSSVEILIFRKKEKT